MRYRPGYHHHCHDNTVVYLLTLAAAEAEYITCLLSALITGGCRLLRACVYAGCIFCLLIGSHSSNIDPQSKSTPSICNVCLGLPQLGEAKKDSKI